MGQYVRSIESYDYALALKEEFAAGWYNRGNACANLGRLYDAADPDDIAPLVPRKSPSSARELARDFMLG